MRLIKIDDLVFGAFNNGVVVLNATPHDINFEKDGIVVTIPSSIIINARPMEEKVDDLLVKTTFVGTPEGSNAIRVIESTFRESGIPGRLVIVGSVIAMNAFPGKVFGMTPMPGFERVAPAEKRMNPSKFITA